MRERTPKRNSLYSRSRNASLVTSSATTWVLHVFPFASKACKKPVVRSKRVLNTCGSAVIIMNSSYPSSIKRVPTFNMDS